MMLPAAGAPRVQGVAPPAGGAGGEAPASVHKEETTVTAGKATKLAAISDAAQPGRAKIAERWATIAAETGSQWHATRSVSLGVTIAERLENCGKEAVTLANPLSGEQLERPVECRQRLCGDCASKRARRTAGRLNRAFKALDLQQRRAGRTRTMITLTVKHSGYAWLDARRLQAAWQRLRSSWYSKQLSRVRQARGKEARPTHKGFAFVRVLELAGGTKRTGHAHLHVVAYLPRWNDWTWWQSAWRKALATSDPQVAADTCTEIPDDAQGVGNVDFADSKQSQSAKLSNYVSKVANYVAKVGADLLQLDSQSAGEFLGEFTGRRWLTASVGFWPLEYLRPTEWILSDTPRAPDRSHLAEWWRAYRSPDGGAG